ncbi:MAG: hypothetical protein PVJ02_04955 [Gemmatimonadota bacterium]
MDDFNFLAANALVGALTGGVLARLHGRSFAGGFTRGALGGGVAYVGKRTAAARFSGAGFLGREVNALGASITRSAAYGSGMLDTLVLPVGPLRVYLTPQDPGGTALRLDLEEAYWLVYGLAEDRLDLDLRRSFSAGASVFTSASRFKGRDGAVDGQAVGGMIVLSRNPRWDAPARIFAHERVHILQFDFFKLTVGQPLERWAVRRLGAADLPLMERVDLGVGHLPLVYLLIDPWRYDRSPLQVEAEFLETRW